MVEARIDEYLTNCQGKSRTRQTLLVGYLDMCSNADTLVFALRLITGQPIEGKYPGSGLKANTRAAAERQIPAAQSWIPEELHESIYLGSRLKVDTWVATQRRILGHLLKGGFIFALVDFYTPSSNFALT